MSGYRFYPTADTRQDEIWDYTFNEWGEQQAEKYIVELHSYMSKLANNKLLWQALPANLTVPGDLSLSVYFSHYNKHYIFFRELSDGMIGVMTILHETMDIPVRLKEDLTNIND
jgi:plasmid stabilization system protein ParE